MNTIELYVDELNPQGWGVASWHRQDGTIRSVCIPNSLPGETVLCDIARCRSKKTQGLLGKVLEVKQPSPDRIPVKCKHFDVCGGCTWQHLPYEKQLAMKEEMLKTLFSELLTEKSIFYPIIACPSAWHYRNKMEFTFSQDLSQEKYLGLIMRCSKGRVFNLEECHLVNPWVSETLQGCYAWWQQSTLQAHYPPKNSGQLRYLTMREAHTTGDRVVILTVSGNPDYPMKQTDLDQFAKVCAQYATPSEPGATLSCIIRIQQTHKGRETQFFEMLLSGPDSFRERITLDSKEIGSKVLEFTLSPSSFFQPNSRQASRIYERALALAELKPDMVLYDLYAGIGIFGMCAAHLVKEVIAIELSADSAYDAKVNSDKLNITNFRMIKADVAKALADKSLPRADVVIVDPPRTGLGKQAIEHIVALSPATIVYVSCNPKTQKIDVQELVLAGYVLAAIQPIDQFAQTIHVENIVILKR